MLARALSTVALGAGAGLVAIAVVAAPGAAVGGVLFGALAAALGFTWVRDHAPADATSKARVGSWGGLIVAAAVTGAWLVLTGLVLLLGPASGPILLLLFATGCAALLRRLVRSGGGPDSYPWRTVPERLLRTAQEVDRSHHDGPGRATRTTASAWTPLPPPIPANMSIRQLCLAWNRTYFVLIDLPPGRYRADVVQVRERLLDEIERRDPEGFLRWLDTGARAGSDPGRYLAGDR